MAGETAASTLANPSGQRNSNPGGGHELGLFSGREWEQIRERSRRILRGATDRDQTLIRSRRRAKETAALLAGDIPSRPGKDIRSGLTVCPAGSDGCISQGKGAVSAGSSEIGSVDKASF